MKVSVMVPHLSNRAGGLAFSVPPVVRAMQEAATLQVSVLGVADRDEGTEQPDWGADVFRARPSGLLGVGSAGQMARALATQRPDVVDVQGIWHWPSVANRRFFRKHHVPYVITPRGMLDPWALRKSVGRKRLAMALVEKQHLNEARCIRVLNADEAAAVKSLLPNVPIATIPNGVPQPELPPKRSTETKKKTLLFLGRIDAKKGVRELVAAWAKSATLATAQGWCLKIVGWGDADYVDEVRASIARLSLANIELSGPAFGDEKLREYREASGFILPSHSEGLPMAVLEAFSYGLPAVMTRFCNIPQGFQAGAALEIDPEENSIAQGLETLFTMSDDARVRMGVSARKLVEERFTVPHVARQCEAMYRWVGGDGPAPEFVEMP